MNSANVHAQWEKIGKSIFVKLTIGKILHCIKTYIHSGLTRGYMNQYYNPIRSNLNVYHFARGRIR